MENIKFLGSIKSWNSVTNELTIKVDFIDPDRMQIIEDIIQSKSFFSFWFTKPFRRMKTYPQLKKYYKMLSIILHKVLEGKPVAAEIKAFDEEIKKSSMACKMLNIFDKDIPIVPSKADFTVEQMSYLIQIVMDRYEALLQGEELE